MKKLSFPKLHVPKIKFLNKTAVLLVVAGLVFLAPFAYGMVRSVQAAKVQAQKDQATAKQQKADQDELVSLRKQVKQQENELTAANAQAGSACDWIRSQQPKYRYVVPQLCKV